LAILYREQKKYQVARVLFRKAASIRAQSLGIEHPLVAESLNGLAGVFSDQGQYIEAIKLYEQAITMREM
jgi:tetratricopeptide (TPR) repeat protein